MRVLAISGSLRRDSNNTALLRALAEEAPSGVEVELWDGLKSIPPYDSDDDVAPGPLRSKRCVRLVRDADAVFFATPEYNSSIPGALKNALDWASRPLATNAFRSKPVAVISSSAGAFGGVWAAAELRRCWVRWAPGSPTSSSRSATPPRSSTTRAGWPTTGPRAAPRRARRSPGRSDAQPRSGLTLRRGARRLHVRGADRRPVGPVRPSSGCATCSRRSSSPTRSASTSSASASTTAPDFAVSAPAVVLAAGGRRTSGSG